MKKCPKCGRENVDEANFCTWCRTELTKERKKYGKGIIIASSVVIGIAFMVGITYKILPRLFADQDGDMETIFISGNDEKLYPTKFMNDEHKWGYKNENNEIVVGCQYDEANDFDNSGYAVVGKETDSDASANYMVYGLINAEGEEIIACENNSIENSVDHYGYRKVSRLPYPFYYDGEYWGVIDSGGSIMISKKYREICNIGNSGYYIAQEAESNMWGIINSGFEWICEPKYSWISLIYDENEDVVETVDEIYMMVAGCDFQEGHAAGIMNMYGEMVVPLEYYDIFPELKGGCLIVENQEGYYGAIDLDGNTVVSCKYIDIDDVYNAQK